jgi:predicted GNAT family acetyltransferase
VRRQGHGARGLGDLCRRLLERAPAVCLFVRSENHAAIRLYETIGMQHVLDYRSVLL